MPEPLNKRDAILLAALELFEERGFHGTAVPLVAERAGVGAGTLYRYFESKEALVNAVFQHWKARLGEAILADFPQGVSVRDQFHAFWRRMADFVTRHPTAFRFLELHSHRPYLNDESLRVEERVLGTARAFLAEAQRQGVLKELPAEVLMAVIWGSFVGLVKASWQGYLKLTPEALDATEQCCWEAIRR